MKKLFKVLMIIACISLMFSIVGCGKNANEEIEERQYEYFDVVEMINNGDYESAKLRIDEVYGDETDYSTTKGHNKALLMRMYYKSQCMYDEAIDEMLKIIKDNNYLDKLEAFDSAGEDSAINEEKYDFQFSVRAINELLERASAEKVEETLSVISREILNKYI